MAETVTIRRSVFTRWADLWRNVEEAYRTGEGNDEIANRVRKFVRGTNTKESNKPKKLKDLKTTISVLSVVEELQVWLDVTLQQEEPVVIVFANVSSNSANAITAMFDDGTQMTLWCSEGDGYDNLSVEYCIEQFRNLSKILAGLGDGTANQTASI